MEICQVETGLLKKTPCGQPGVTHCMNCEQALCSKHAVAQLNEAGHKTGKFLCKECASAQKEAAKIVATKPDAPAAAVPKPAAAAPKPAALAPAATKPAAATAAPAQGKPENKPKPDMDDSGPIEFTPTKK
jgi:hypothetical protein